MEVWGPDHWTTREFPGMEILDPLNPLCMRVGFLVVLATKNLPANAGDVRDAREEGSIPGGGHGNPLQYSCLENPMDRGAWWATVHRVTKSQT